MSEVHDIRFDARVAGVCVLIGVWKPGGHGKGDMQSVRKVAVVGSLAYNNKVSVPLLDGLEAVFLSIDSCGRSEHPVVPPPLPPFINTSFSILFLFVDCCLFPYFRLFG